MRSIIASLKDFAKLCFAKKRFNAAEQREDAENISVFSLSFSRFLSLYIRIKEKEILNVKNTDKS